jgi:HK97 family phage prohead protease
MDDTLIRLSHMTGTKGSEILDEAQGIVEAIVSGAGNKDSVGDIVMPGAFAKSLEDLKPRVVWGHDWNHPIGKVLEIYEIPGSDPRLPKKAKGFVTAALYVKVQFNLLSEKGREAFSMVAFFGEEQEWSIGYKTTKQQYDPMVKANRLHEVKLYEVSPVLHGANNLTGTVSVKDAEMADVDVAEKQTNMIQRRETLTRALVGRTKSPVSLVDINDDEAKIVYQTDASETFSASFTEKDDGEVLFGNPTKVRLEVRYVPEEEEKSFEDNAIDAVDLAENAVVDIKTGTCSCGGSCGGGAKAEEEVVLEEEVVVEKDALVITVESEIDQDELEKAFAMHRVTVDGKNLILDTEVDEDSMKREIAVLLSDRGVTAISTSRLSSTNELE